MKIIKYISHSYPRELSYSPINFGNINLIVGDSATGKSMLLNTIFNLACFVVRKQFYIGFWDVVIEHQDSTYHWTLKCTSDPEGGRSIESEQLARIADGHEEVLIAREHGTFTFKDTPLPKIGSEESGVSLLKEEEVIRPLYEGLGLVMRRDFSGSELEDASSLGQVPRQIINSMKKSAQMRTVFLSNLNLNGRMFLLSDFFPDVYAKIVDEFRNAFPFVKEIEVKRADFFGLPFPGVVPVLAIQEKHVEGWTHIGEFSSGMKKVLLILCDIFTMPEEGGIYLIDEYENSLGINAINFFPGILNVVDTPIQFIITSHHPYIIGNVPVRDWIVLSRRGKDIAVKQGTELEKQFGKSKQKAFIQLINDPFYKQGVSE